MIQNGSKVIQMLKRNSKRFKSDSKIFQKRFKKNQNVSKVIQKDSNMIQM